MQTINWNCVFALRECAAAWSWRLGCKSCTVSKVSSQPDWGYSCPPWAMEQHRGRDCCEVHALPGITANHLLPRNWTLIKHSKNTDGKKTGGRWSSLICLCCLCWASERDMLLLWAPSCTLCEAAPLSGPKTMDELRSSCHCPVLVSCTELDPRFQIFQSVLLPLFASVNHCTTTTLERSRHSLIMNINRAFQDFWPGSELRISWAGPCLHSTFWTQTHGEKPLGNDVRKLALNFAFPWCRTK